MKAVRISVCLFLVAILTIMLDIGYDIVLSNECMKTLKRQVMLDTYYCNSMQEEYFSQDNFRMGNLVELSVPGSSAFYCQSPYATPAYSDFIDELSTSGDSYLTLCAGILKDASGVPNPNYSPAQLNLAYIDENVYQEMFERYLKYTISNSLQGYKNHIIIDNVSTTVTPHYIKYSPEVLRSIYGNDEQLIDIFKDLDIARYEQLASILTKDRVLPCYTVTITVNATFVSQGYFNSREANQFSSLFRTTRNNYTTPAEQVEYNVAVDQLKWALDPITITFEIYS